MREAEEPDLADITARDGTVESFTAATTQRRRRGTGLECDPAPVKYLPTAKMSLKRRRQLVRLTANERRSPETSVHEWQGLRLRVTQPI